MLALQSLDEVAVPLLLLRDLLALPGNCLLQLRQLLEELCHLLDVEGRCLRNWSHGYLRLLLRHLLLIVRRSSASEGIFFGL